MCTARTNIHTYSGQKIKLWQQQASATNNSICFMYFNIDSALRQSQKPQQLNGHGN